MAIYHLSAKVGKRQTGQSGGAKSDYLQREGKYSRRSDEVLFKVSGNMPSWAIATPSEYWRSADLFERANGKLFYEVEVALPKELDLSQQSELVMQFANHLASYPKDVNGALPYTLAIHKGNGTNPHCHIMLSERGNDGIARDQSQWFKRADKKHPERGGAAKTRSMQPRSWLDDTRVAWMDHANHALKRYGHEARIDHRSYESQGVELIPGVHLGPNVIEMEEKGIRTDRGGRALEREREGARFEALKQEEERLNHELDSIRQGPEIAKYRDFGGADRAVGTSDGRLGGRREAGHDRDPAGGASPNHKLDRSTGEGCSVMEGRHRKDGAGDGSSSAAAGESRSGMGRSDAASANTISEYQGRNPRIDPYDMGIDSSIDSGDCDSAVGRILDLAIQNVTIGSEADGREPTVGIFRESVRRIESISVAGVVSKSQPKAPGGDPSLIQRSWVEDRTAESVRNQLRAMGCERYDIGIRDQMSGKMMNREWGKTQVIDAIPWLKRMNARGNDIYIRPAKSENHGLVLVDDVDGVTLAEMNERGHSPCCVIETSPKNHQAWVKFTAQALSEACRGEIGKTFVEMYEADKNSADSRHYGRLAGFTNRKPQHENRYGQQPYCLLRDSSGKSVDGEGLIQKAENAIQDREKTRRIETIKAFGARNEFQINTVDEYKRQMRVLYQRYGEDIDLSRADFMVCKSMLQYGYPSDQIKDAVACVSPNIESRKAGHIRDYAERTVNNALRDVEQEQKMDCGMRPRM